MSFETEKLLKILQDEGYYQRLRVLEDGTIIGIGELITTTALYIGMDTLGWERRYCYTDQQALENSYNAIKTGDDVPTGWIASRNG